VQGLDQLLGDLAHFLLGQVLVVLQNLEQLAVCLLSHQTEFVVGLKTVQQQNNIGVLQTFQNRNLLSQII